MIPFLWIAFAIFVGIFADKKKTEPAGIGMFFISLLLSPLIGLIIVLVSKPSEKRMLENGGLKKCPQCAELVKKEAIKCKFCGADLSNAVPQITEPKKEEIKVEKQKTPPKPMTKRRMLTYIIIGVLVIVTLSILYHSFDAKSSL